VLSGWGWTGLGLRGSDLLGMQQLVAPQCVGRRAPIDEGGARLPRGLEAADPQRRQEPAVKRIPGES